MNGIDAARLQRIGFFHAAMQSDFNLASTLIAEMDIDDLNQVKRIILNLNDLIDANLESRG